MDGFKDVFGSVGLVLHSLAGGWCYFSAVGPVAELAVGDFDSEGCPHPVDEFGGAHWLGELFVGLLDVAGCPVLGWSVDFGLGEFAACDDAPVEALGVGSCCEVGE